MPPASDADGATPALVPELAVADLARSLRLYVSVFGFTIHAERPEERFAYLVRDGAHLMLEESRGPGRRFHDPASTEPFGHGLNLQIRIADVDDLHARVVAAGLRPHLPLEERWYRQGVEALGQRQFVVADRDGYLLRFAQDLGRRPAACDAPSPQVMVL